MRSNASGKREPGVAAVVAAWATVLLVSGCAVPIRPSDLPVPAKVTCLQLATPLESTETRGLLSIVWITRLERGPYVAEREDDEGTYFRAPPGGISVTAPAEAKRMPLAYRSVADGGFWIPRDPSKLPRVYRYLSTESAAVTVPPASAHCATSTYTRDPVTQDLRLMDFAAGGAVAGATGAVVARSMGLGAPRGMSYGQSAAVGAVGGAIGGLIVASLINMDMGKIMFDSTTLEGPFVDALRRAAQDPITLDDISPGRPD